MSSTLAYDDRVGDATLTPSRRVAAGSALLAVACVLGLVEAALPGLPFAPWLRFGFANIAVVIALAIFGGRIAAVVSIGRVAIVGLATGSLLGPTSVLAAAGAAASLAVMWLLARHVPGASPVSWSAAGSAAHVVAQFGVASALLGTGSLLVLAPPSVLVALLLGAFVGYLALVAASRLRNG